MSIDFAWRILLFVGELFAGSSLIVGLAVLATRAVKDRASLRHLIWMTAFGALLLLPALAAWLPPRAILAAPQAAALVPMAREMADLPPEMPAPSPAPWRPDAPAFLTGLFLVWVPGLFWSALRTGTGLFGLHILRRDSAQWSPACIALPALANRDWELRIATRAGSCGPMAFGLLKPVVLMPMQAAQWPRERLEAVLLHETAHLDRRDSASRMFAQAVCTLYWPNPLVWVALKALNREAEIAADDAVLSSGVRPSSYAHALLELAAEFKNAHARAAATRADLGLAMAAQPALAARVQAILAANPSRTGVTKMDAMKIACLGVSATALLALARPSFADQPAPPPPAMTVPAAPAAPHAPAAPAAPPLATAADGDTVMDDRMEEDPGTHAVTASGPVASRHRHGERGPHDRVIVGSPERHHAQGEAQTREVLTREAEREDADARVEQARARAEDARERAEQSAEAARQHAEEAMARAREKMDQASAKIREAGEAGREEAREMVREAIDKDGADRARVLAQVRLEVNRAVAQAQVERKVALAQAHAELEAALAQAKAEAHDAIVRAQENAPRDD